MFPFNEPLEAFNDGLDAVKQRDNLYEMLVKTYLSNPFASQRHIYEDFIKRSLPSWIASQTLPNVVKEHFKAKREAQQEV